MPTETLKSGLTQLADDVKYEIYAGSRKLADLESDLGLAQHHSDQLELSEQVHQTIKEVGEQLQTTTYSSIQKLATFCLQEVFGTSYACSVEAVQRRGKVEVDISVIKDGIKLDPLTACGGGIADVLGLALRVGVILSDNVNKPRRIIIADEPCRFVSEEYRSRVSELLVKLSTTYGFQLIMVTHDSEFQIGKVIEVE